MFFFSDSRPRASIGHRPRLSAVIVLARNPSVRAGVRALLEIKTTRLRLVVASVRNAVTNSRKPARGRMRCDRQQLTSGCSLRACGSEVARRAVPPAALHGAPRRRGASPAGRRGGSGARARSGLLHERVQTAEGWRVRPSRPHRIRRSKAGTRQRARLSPTRRVPRARCPGVGPCHRARGPDGDATCDPETVRTTAAGERPYTDVPVTLADEAGPSEHKQLKSVRERLTFPLRASPFHCPWRRVRGRR